MRENFYNYNDEILITKKQILRQNYNFQRIFLWTFLWTNSIRYWYSLDQWCNNEWYKNFSLRLILIKHVALTVSMEEYWKIVHKIWHILSPFFLKLAIIQACYQLIWLESCQYFPCPQKRTKRWCRELLAYFFDKFSYKNSTRILIICLAGHKWIKWIFTLKSVRFCQS